jgi:hypothetical protein
MSLIDTHRLLSDRKYRILLCEYHSLVAYIADDLNRYPTIQCAGVQFHKTSELYAMKEDLIDLLRATFPRFEVSLEKHGEQHDLKEDEFNICVSWKHYQDNTKLDN